MVSACGKAPGMPGLGLDLVVGTLSGRGDQPDTRRSGTGEHHQRPKAQITASPSHSDRGG